MKLLIHVLFLVSALLIEPQMVHAQFSTVYVTSSSVYHIETNQGLGTNYKTDRSGQQGYFSAEGTALFNNASDAQHINGYMKHIPTSANQTYTFEVGSGTDLRKITVSGSRPQSAIIGTAWIVGNPTTTPDPTNNNAMHNTASVTGVIKAVSSVGQWDWVDLSTSQTEAGGVTVTVSIPDMSSFATQANLRLVGWDGSAWRDLSGTSTATGVTENSSLSGTIPTGAVIQALAVGSVVAPVDLIPIVYVQPTIFYGANPITVVVDVIELRGNNTNGLISVRVNKQSNVSLTFDGAATTIGGRNVHNTQWTLDNSNTSYYKLTTNASITGGSKLSFGFSGTLTPEATSGSLSISTVIEGGSGGEVRIINNTDSERIDYFPQ